MDAEYALIECPKCGALVKVRLRSLLVHMLFECW